MLALTLFLAALGTAPTDQATLRYPSIKLLFCAFGSIGLQPVPPPPGFENEFAEAVVEINNDGKVVNAPLPYVTLYAEHGKVWQTKRVVSVEVFDEPWVRGEGDVGFYMGTRGNTHAWDRVLLGGMIRLRVRVALNTQQWLRPMPNRCKVTFGPDMVEGPVDGEWPT